MQEMAEETEIVEDDDKTGATDDKTEEDPAVLALKAHNAKLLKEKRDAQAKARELEAKEAERAAEIAEKEEEAARKKGDFEKVETRLTKERDDARGEVQTWKAKYESKVIGDEIRDGLEAVNAKPELRKMLTTYLESTLDIELDDDGKASIAGQPVAEYLKAWAKTDEGKNYIASGSTGGGASGGGNGGGDANPWAKETWNMTEQGRLYRANPERARAMARAHGHVLT